MNIEVRGWTALRGIAAIWVVLFHFSPHLATPFEGAWIENGYWGVDVFFTLSGAVLYYVYAATFADGLLSYKDFLWKRFARLYPVHFVTLFASVVILVGGPMAGVGLMPDYDIGKAVLINLSLLQSWNLTPGLTLGHLDF